MIRPLILFLLATFFAHAQEELPIPDIQLPPGLLNPLPSPSDSPLPNPDQPFTSILDGGSIKNPTGVQINGTPQFDFQSGKQIISYLNGISLETDTNLQATADRAVWNITDGLISLSGNVSLYQDGIVYRGQSATYDINRKTFDTSQLRSGIDPILMEAGKFRVVEENGSRFLIGEDAGITTHDVENPDFWLRARKATIFPGNKVIFNDLTLETQNRKLFWLPYLAQELDQNLGFLVMPGSRSNLGPFVKTRYGLMLGGERDPVTGENKDAWLLSQWHADFYSLRGLGLGLDLLDTRLDDQDQFGYLKLFYIHDFNPSKSRAGVPRRSVDPDRFRVDFAQRLPLWESLNAKYSFDSTLTILSDEFFLEDFDPSQFRLNRAPDNFLALVRRSANSITSFDVRLRPNSFYQSDTRLPEITHDWLLQPLFDSPILYESQSSLGFYREYLPTLERASLRNQAAALLPGDPRLPAINRLLDDRGYGRLHTFHEFSSPFKIGHFQVTPRLGAGHAEYFAIQGPDNTFSRTHLSAGLDFSTKLSKSYPNLINKKWGLNGARHIIEPYASLNFLSTNNFDSSFKPIDRITPSTRPLPRQIGRFTAVDELADWQIIRLGLRNHLLTGRNQSPHPWLVLDTYFDAFLEDPEFDRNFSNLYNDLRWQPVPWFALDLETQFPLFSESNFNEIATSLNFMPNPNFEFSLDYRHLNNHPILRGSDRIVLDTFWRLNEYWGIGTHHRVELTDRALELQQYQISHDFDSFVGSLGFFHRNNPEQNEYGFIVSFGIKEIPSLALPIKLGAEY